METFVYYTAPCCIVLGSSEVLSYSLLVRKTWLLSGIQKANQIVENSDFSASASNIFDCEDMSKM